jgi:[protein-PII] uridylyltransferase
VVAPVPASRSLRNARQALLDDRTLTGTEWCRQYAAAADAWLQELFAAATGGQPKGLALLAVGGFGRATLAPGSDVDLLLVHDGHKRIKSVADAVWYPIWDAGIALDHSVRTPKEVRGAMDSDIKVALGLLDARPIAGDENLARDVLRKARDLWQTRLRRWLPALDNVTRARHERSGDLAFLLEPDLKEARGGLRDLHLLRSLGQVAPVLASVLEDPRLAGAGETLEAARVELQRITGRPTSALLLQDQDAVAAALDFPDADALMLAVAHAARAIAWTNDDGWRRLESWLAGPRGRGGSRDRHLEPGIVLRDDEVTLAADAPLEDDPSLALRVAAASAELDKPIARPTLDRLGEAATVPAPDTAWRPEVLHALVRLLGAGPPAVAAVEALDSVGIWVRYLPEWEPIRNRPQRNAYHRYTVDRHLLETAAGAAAVQSSVARPDLLLLGALLHDIGKGRPHDHTDLGIELVGTVGPRLGLPAPDTATLQTLVRHHLLLAETATRRDLDDPATAAAVAVAVGDTGTLELLAALTEADSVATGPSAWGSWKAGLVAQLIQRVGAVLRGQPVASAHDAPLSPEQRALLAPGRLEVLADGSEISIAAPDRSGLLATVAGILTLSGVTVRSATTVSDEPTGMALLRFDVAPAYDSLPDWGRVREDLAAALDGRLALDERLAEQERQHARYARYRRQAQAATVAPEVRVRIDNDASDSATVVEVRAPDRGPVLYRITRALTGSGLIITRALINTLGTEAMDIFYVQEPSGTRVTDTDRQQQLAAAITAAL